MDSLYAADSIFAVNRDNCISDCDRLQRDYDRSILITTDNALRKSSGRRQNFHKFTRARERETATRTRSTDRSQLFFQWPALFGPRALFPPKKAFGASNESGRSSKIVIAFTRHRLIKKVALARFSRRYASAALTNPAQQRARARFLYARFIYRATDSMGDKPNKTAYLINLRYYFTDVDTAEMTLSVYPPFFPQSNDVLCCIARHATERSRRTIAFIPLCR